MSSASAFQVGSLKSSLALLPHVTYSPGFNFQKFLKKENEKGATLKSQWIHRDLTGVSALVEVVVVQGHRVVTFAVQARTLHHYVLVLRLSVHDDNDNDLQIVQKVDFGLAVWVQPLVHVGSDGHNRQDSGGWRQFHHTTVACHPVLHTMSKHLGKTPSPCSVNHLTASPWDSSGLILRRRRCMGSNQALQLIKLTRSAILSKSNHKLMQTCKKSATWAKWQVRYRNELNFKIVSPISSLSTCTLQPIFNFGKKKKTRKDLPMRTFPHQPSHG